MLWSGLLCGVDNIKSEWFITTENMKQNLIGISVYRSLARFTLSSNNILELVILSFTHPSPLLIWKIAFSSVHCPMSLFCIHVLGYRTRGPFQCTFTVKTLYYNALSKSSTRMWVEFAYGFYICLFMVLERIDYCIQAGHELGYKQVRVRHMEDLINLMVLEFD